MCKPDEKEEKKTPIKVDWSEPDKWDVLASEFSPESAIEDDKTPDKDIANDNEELLPW